MKAVDVHIARSSKVASVFFAVGDSKNTIEESIEYSGPIIHARGTAWDFDLEKASVMSQLTPFPELRDRAFMHSLHLFVHN